MTILRPSASEDALTEQLRRGERAFFESTRSGASCQTCHVDADSDHAWHDIGHTQPRPTLSVRGISATAPYLRGASYPTLAGLDTFARTLLGDYRRVSPTRAEDLAAFVRSLSPLDHPRRRSADTKKWLREGLAVFDEAGCPACHPAPAFTALGAYPSALLFGDQPSRAMLDTPSLLSVSQTPPYLFDGRATDLTAVFEDHDPLGRHGTAQRLSADQRARIIQFLEHL